MATTLKSGEVVEVLCELGFPTQIFTLDDATLGVLDGGGYLDGTLLGDDVSPYIPQLSTTRGRTDPLGSFNAGTCTIVLNNNDRRFDPINQSSPYWNTALGRSGITPRRKVTVTSGGVALFTGRITDIDIDYDYKNSTVTLSVADDFVLLANATTANVLTPVEQLSGARVSYLLDLPEINYSATTRSIATGTSGMGAYQIDANTNALTYLQKIAESEQGLCFIAADGYLTFTDRLSAAFATIAATFSDAGTGIPYQTLSVLYGQEQLYNRVQATVIGGTVQSAEDTASQTEFGVSTYAIDNLLLSTDAEALTLANDLLATYSQPVYRFDDLTVSVSSLGAVDRATVVGLEIGDTIAITRTYDAGLPLSTTQYYAVDRIQHTLTAAQHLVTFGLRVADIVYPFILAGFPVPTVSRTNLVANPNFETNTTGWGVDAGVTLTRSTADFYSGTASALLSNTIAGQGINNLSNRQAASAGLSYTASAYIKKASGVNFDYSVRLFFYDAASNILSAPISGTYTIGGGWERQSVTATAPANTTTVGVQVLRRNIAGAANFYVDAIMIEQASTALPYFDGTYVDAYTGYGLDSKGWNGTANASSSTTSWFVGNSRTNLVTNPSFETNASLWTPVSSTLTRVAGTFGSGAWVGQCVSTITATNFYSTPDSITVSGGTTLTASATVLRTVGTRNHIMYFQWFNGATFISDTVGTANACATPTRLSVTGTAPANTTRCRVVVAASTAGAIGDTFQVDSVLCEQTASVLPYFDGTYVDAYAGFGLYSKAWNGTTNNSTSTANWYVGNTRINRITNPSFETDLSNWSSGQTGFVRSTDLAYSGTNSLKVIVNTADSNVAYHQSSSYGVGSVTLSLYVYTPLDSTLAGRTISTSVEGGTAVSGVVTNNAATLVAGQWVRVSHIRNVTAAGTMVVVYRLSGTMGTAAGQLLYFDAALGEQSSSVLPYFDGTYADTYTGYTLESQAWNGTANASTSTAVWGLTSSYVGTPMDSDYALA